MASSDSGLSADCASRAAAASAIVMAVPAICARARWRLRAPRSRRLVMKGRVANLISSVFVPELTFLGAARTVTGSKYLLRHGNATVLFDCGLFQGLKELRLRNWQDLPVPASSINAVVLTLAHLDHVGYVPRLVKHGFSGPVFCTSGTAELSRLVLPDSGRIQEEDARLANRHGYSKHSPAMPTRTARSATSIRWAFTAKSKWPTASASSSWARATCSDLPTSSRV